MSIANKAISTTFFNIIIRTYHGQTKIVIQYGCLRSSVICVNTSCNNDSFASPTHTTKQSLDKTFSDVVTLVHNASHSACSVFRGLWGWWTRLLSSSYKCAIVDWSGDNVGQSAYPCGAPEFTSGFSGVRVAWSLVWYLCFVDRCLSFSTFSVVFSSSIYGFWLPLWYLQSLLWSRLSTWQSTMLRGLCLSRLSEPESHPFSSLADIITGSVNNCTFIGWTQ
jgi:hypothetical protein